MKLTAMALATAFALSSTCALAHTVRHESKARSHTTYRNAVVSAADPKANFSGHENGDVWGHWGAYYGPMIPAGAGGR
jgi:hypothetical protein